jgi:hypothetical protein
MFDMIKPKNGCKRVIFNTKIQHSKRPAVQSQRFTAPHLPIPGRVAFFEVTSSHKRRARGPGRWTVWWEMIAEKEELIAHDNYKRL